MSYRHRFKNIFLKLCYASFILLLITYILISDSENRRFRNFEKISNGGKAYIKSATTTTKITASEKQKYYVYSAKCRIPYVEPFTPKILEMYQPCEYKNCTTDVNDIVTYTFDVNLSLYVLHINESVAYEKLNSVNTNYTEKSVDENESENDEIICCYKEIQATGSEYFTDEQIRLLPCEIFTDGFIVPNRIHGMLVECHSALNTSNIIQEDAFAFVQYPNKSNTKDIKSSSSYTRKPSILMFGIDSMSRINLRRTMPLTYAYLERNEWYEMQGYNKIDDNTFPNLMAILTGYNDTSARDICKPYTVGGLDQCPFIWKKFKDAGYSTAYGEDEYQINTFNFDKRGFSQQPVDHYMRSFMVAAQDNLPEYKLYNLHYCIGRRQAFSYVYDYGIQLINRYREEPYFGLFWVNSFSHDLYDMPSAIDKQMLKYFEKFEITGALNDTIIIFFSDHGMRWGPLLELPEGFLEERLPMLFIWLPLWFRQKYPKYTHSLHLNRNRLSSPYDLHLTLKHILTLDDDTGDRASDFVTTDCHKCQSLLNPVPVDRSCDEAGIIEHWCTCIPYEIVTDESIAIKVTNLIIDEINSYVDDKNFTLVCSNLTFNSTILMEKKLILDDENSTATVSPLNEITYRIKFITNPNEGVFQATIIYNDINNTIEIDVETISRLNTYMYDAHCITDKQAKKYCFCREPWSEE